MRHPFVLREGCISTIPPMMAQMMCSPFFLSSFAQVFPNLGPSIGSPLVNTSSDDSFSAAFRPVHTHPPLPSPLARPPPSSFPTSSSSPSLRPFSCLLTHTHVRQWYVCYITLCTAARWSTYLWPMYTYVRVIPGTYIQGESYRKYFLNLRRF